MKKVSGVFVSANGVATNVECGFVPDKVKIITDLDGGTNEFEFEWYKCLADKASYGQYGITYNASGVPAESADAANGIIAYDTSANKVMVESPKPGVGKLEVSVADWAADTSYASGERSATAIGTIVRPPTHNGYVYELTTDTGNGTSEPSSWPTVPGQTCTDGGSNIWTCRNEEVVRGGAKGFTLGATVSLDGEICVFEAEMHDKHGDLGDADNTNPVKFP